ncbi:MAG: hypothetical protein L0I79_03745 [Atopostipes sp.]|nr:hypothetical protein [Atopostipes sp.]
MEKLKFDLLDYLLKEEAINKANLSELLAISRNKVEQLLNELIKEGSLNEDWTLTERKREELQNKRPRSAIIFADNLGLAMLTVSKNIPVGLLEMNGTVIVERLIKQLKEVGIDTINIIVGFQKEKYNYLKEKYHVNLIDQTELGYYASFSSLKLVEDSLENSYILPGNIWAEKNPFSKNEYYSWYGILDTVDDYSIVRLRPGDELIKAEKDRAGNTMTGIAYLAEKEANFILEKLRKINTKKQKEKIWEANLFDAEKKMILYPKVFHSNQIYLINTYQQLQHLEKDSTPLDAEMINIISEALSVNNEEIINISVLEEGKTNSNFRFTVRDEDYIMRIPGKGTDELVNRAHEYNVYCLLKGHHISDEVIYLSPENGYKISKFIRRAKTCNPYNKRDVKRCIKKLKIFH